MRIFSLSSSLSFSFLVLTACGAAIEGQNPGECADGADNDGNGAFDCDDEGCSGSPDCEGGDDTATSQNAAPSGAAIAITPATPGDDDDLTCSIVTEATDPNGDTVTYRYAWKVNGGDAGISGQTVSAAQTSGGESWTCTVTPNDGVLDGTAASASVTIAQGNRAPSAPTVSINPAEPTDDDVLICVIDTESVDPDGDAVTYTYAWSVDGADTGRTGKTLGSDITEVGQQWTCTAIASDGDLETQSSSTSVEISSSCGEGTIAASQSGVDFVEVCGETFDMGCTSGAGTCGSDETLRSVTLTRNYYVSVTEVTQDQYSDLMGVNPSGMSACGGDCPVETVNWHMAAAYTNVLSRAAGLTSCYSCTGSGDGVNCRVSGDPYSCSGYRLLTEAEWEHAARCGEDYEFSGSDSIDVVGWIYGYTTVTMPVGGKRANACGLYDMSGNVFELVNDFYGTISSADAVDPVGPSSGSYVVDRGGSWFHGASWARVAARDGTSLPSSANTRLGFRVGRTAP